MANIVDFDSRGNVIYQGVLSSSQIAVFDEVVFTLKQEIPKIEMELKEKYGDTIEYKYNLGHLLDSFLKKYNVKVKERRRFWDEIKKLASTETRTREEGQNSRKRSFYEQCYRLSQIDYDIVCKLSWRQWQSLLDRNDQMTEDPRFLVWIQTYPAKIKEDEWRELLKALNEYLYNKDLSVFEDDEIFCIYNTIMLMCKTWLSELKAFSKDHPTSLKLEKKAKWSKKYYAECFSLAREGVPTDESSLVKVFARVMA